MYSWIDIQRELAVKNHVCNRPAAQEKLDKSLRKAHTAAMAQLFSNSLKTIENAIKYDPGVRHTTVVMKPDDVQDKLHGHSFEFVMLGLWNAKEEQYGRRPHHLCGLFKSPVEELEVLLQARGIQCVENLTNRDKGKNIVLKIIF